MTGRERLLIARHPLGHEPSHSGRLPRREQVVGGLRPQAVGRRGIAFRVALHPRKRGQLMDDHLRPGPTHGLGDLIGIKRIRHHRQSAQLTEHRQL